MTGELTINEEIISLKPDTVIAMTFAVSDIADIANRKGNGSNSFRVPRTQSNIAKLGHSDKVSSLSNLPYEKLPARYLQKGIQIVKSGYAVLSEVGDDFEITLYDGNVPFFETIDKKKLSELDFSALDHLWILANVHGYRLNTSDIIYPIIDYGQAPTFFPPTYRSIDINFLLPWIFIHTVIEKIFSTAGWTLTGNFIATSLYNNLIINLPTLNVDEDLLLAHATSTVQETLTSADSPGNINGILFGTQDSDPLEAILPPGSLVNTAFSTHYVVLYPGSYSFRATLIYDLSGNDQAYIWIRNANGPVDQYLAEWKPVNNTNGTHVMLALDCALIAGDEIVVEMISYPDIPITGFFHIEIGSTFECIKAVASAVPGTQLNISLNLPDMTQKDLLKSLMQQYCILPMTNTLTKNVQFVQFGEIVTNKWQALDWTDKVDMSVESNKQFHPSTYAQKNNLKYLDDDTVTNELDEPIEIGTGFFEIADETLPLEKDLLTLPFAPSPMASRFSQVQVPVVQRWDVTNFEWKDGKPKILILDKQVLDIAFIYKDDSGGITNTDPENLAYFILPGKTNNLGFDDNLITEHYEDFVNMLNGYKKVTLSMKLSAVDIESLDFSIPIYLQQFSAYFFINKISQWIDLETGCDVELVKID